MFLFILRHYVISHFAFLESLDGENVTEQERKRAYEIYGRRWKFRDRMNSSIY